MASISFGGTSGSNFKKGFTREEQAERVAETLKKQKELHFNKTQNSYSAFQNTRVTSCSGVLMKNGHSVAMAFPNPN